MDTKQAILERLAMHRKNILQDHRHEWDPYENIGKAKELEWCLVLLMKNGKV